MIFDIHIIRDGLFFIKVVLKTVSLQNLYCNRDRAYFFHSKFIPSVAIYPITIIFSFI